MKALFIGPRVPGSSTILLLPSLETANCTIPAFPGTISDYEIMAFEKGVQICGGIFDKDTAENQNLFSSECFRLPYGSKNWLRSSSIPNMIEKRGLASSVNFDNGEFWILGGIEEWSLRDARHHSSIEVLLNNGSWTKSSVTLPEALAYHCTVRIDSNRILITGGSSGKVHGSYSAATYLYDQRTNIWERKQDMATSRGTHSCALLEENRVLVTGG